MTLPLLLALAIAAPASAAPCCDAQLTSVKGEVVIYSRSNPQGIAARPGLSLRAGDRVSTGARSSVEARLGYGGLLRLGADSSVALLAMEPDLAEFHLTAGTLLARSQVPWRVRTPAAVATGQRAEFGVVVPPRDRGQTRIAVFDNGPAIVSGRRGSSALLLADQETSVFEGAGPEAASGLRELASQRRFLRAMRRAAPAGR